MSLDDLLLGALDGEWRSLRELRIHANTRLLITPAQRLQRRGLVESRLSRANYNLVYRRTPHALAAATGTAKTAKQAEGEASQSGHDSGNAQ